MPLAHPYTASTLAQSFLKNIFKYLGLLNSITFDRNKTFTSQFWRGLFNQQGVKLAFNTAYYVQTDGQLEVINMTLENYLRFFIGERLKKWVQWIPIAKWWYNMTTHAYTQLAPFEALYGYPPLKLLSYIAIISTVKAVDATLK